METNLLSIYGNAYYVYSVLQHFLNGTNCFETNVIWGSAMIYYLIDTKLLVGFTTHVNAFPCNATVAQTKLFNNRKCFMIVLILSCIDCSVCGRYFNVGKRLMTQKIDVIWVPLPCACSINCYCLIIIFICDYIVWFLLPSNFFFGFESWTLFFYGKSYG